MTLQTKIICISGTVILSALLICGLLTYKISSDSMLEEAAGTAYVESSRVRKDFEAFLSQLGENVGETEVGYYFKSRRDDYTICVKNGIPYYNNTILSLDDLIYGEYNERFELPYKEYTAAGRNLLIFKFPTSAGLEIYHAVDITHVYDKTYVLAVSMICISVSVTAVSVAMTAIIMKRTLAPLIELSEGAKSIAGGAYYKRVPVSTRDEIGTLAREFNVMAEAIESHTRELEDSEMRKTLLMGNLTHELKTPLTAISGYAQTMRTAVLSEDDKKEALTYIYEESKRLDRISKKMMRLLELDQNTEIVFSDISIRKLFETSAKICKESAGAKNIDIIICDADGTIPGDFDLMCEVIVNLIDNAVKASSEGSSIKLYTEDGDIIVRDFGCGIPDSEIPKITEPFYMVDKSRSRKSGGAGLGLALTKLILKYHEMDLSVESEVGKGTKIRVYKSFASR